ncbi:MAG: amino acid adenylation domain-containing protein, partial [Deltaproteobacteria bacterium]|nr:amino acid adenylation domain-containing protein [Deltaproteobacteria bacterium]
MNISRFQAKFILEDKLLAGKPFNNFPILYEIRGPLDVAVLRQALSAIMATHDSMRARFPEVEGVLSLVLEKNAEPPFEVVHLDDEAAIEAFSREFVLRPFHLASEPPHRTALVQRGPNDFLLLFVVHHILTDGVTLEPLLPQWAAAYNALISGDQPPVVQADSYADYIEMEQAQQLDFSNDFQFWHNYLGDAPLTVALPHTHGPEGFKTLYFEIEGVLREKLNHFARKHKSTPFWLLTAAWATLLNRYSDQEIIPINYPVNLRPPRFSHLLGPFINNLPILARCGDEVTFTALLAQMTTDRRICRPHQRPMLADIVEYLRRHGKAGGTVLNVGIAETALRTTYPFPLSGCSVRALTPPPVGLAAELLLEYDERPDAVHCRLTYDGSRYTESFTRQMTRHLLHILKAVPDNADRPLYTLLAADSTDHAFLQCGIATDMPFPPFRPLHSWFEEHAAQDPERIALTDIQGKISYGALKRRTDQIARSLCAWKDGVQGRAVGICLPRETDLVAALLGVLKAGGVYLPLDPDLPPARRACMLKDAQAAGLIASREQCNRIFGERENVLPLLDLSTLSHEAAELSSSFHETLSSDPAYIIYTSGSTGQPKGVVIEHGALANQIEWFQYVFKGNPDDVVLQKTPIGFDASIWELFWWMRSGAQLVLLEPQGEKQPSVIAKTIARHRVNIVQFVPSLLREVLRVAEKDELASVRHLFCGGETLTGDLVAKIREQPGFSGQIHNLYGPTETTVDASWHTVPTPALLPIPIGKPVANTRIYLLDRHKGLQLPFLPGELCIAGVQVARGYLHRPELTARHFIEWQNERLYRSGDLARWTENGELEFLGRIDRQVKLRGLRIETEEIEAALLRCMGVTAAAVRLYGADGDRLGAWVSGTVDPENLRKQLAQTLPEYMLPNVIVRLDALPHTASGKIDYRALPEPKHGEEKRQNFAPPRTPEEELLCMLFAEILGLKQVGRDDDFVRLGGHSLLAIRLQAAIHRAFGVELPFAALFTEGTPAHLAQMLAQASPLPSIHESQLTRAPLSHAQLRLWFLDRFEDGGSVNNIPLALRLRGELNVAALETALHQLFARHAALHTVVETDENGHAFQVVRDFTPEPLVPEPCAEAELANLMRQEAGIRFDLCEGPLLRWRLLRFGVKDHVLLLSLHHLVCDGWSCGILFKELSELYDAHCAGRAPNLSPVSSVSYIDFTLWQRNWLDEERINGESLWWRRELADIPQLLGLPTDRVRPEILSNHGDRVP